jgi:hypothetical protein
VGPRLLTNATVFFIVGQLVGTNAASLLGPYGTNYITFILVGMMLYYFWLTNFRDPFSRIRRVYFGGTMDLYMLSPIHPHTPMLGLMGRSVFGHRRTMLVAWSCSRRAPRWRPRPTPCSP